MLYRRIEQLRKDHKMSQSSLGELLNVTQQAVAKWEKGISEPDCENIIRISKIFNVDVNFLLGITNNPNPSVKAELTLEESIRNNINLSDESKAFMLKQLELVTELDEARQNNELAKEFQPKLA